MLQTRYNRKIVISTLHKHEKDGFRDLSPTTRLTKSSNKNNIKSSPLTFF